MSGCEQAMCCYPSCSCRVPLSPPAQRKPFVVWLREKIDYHRSSFTAIDALEATAALAAIDQERRA